LDIYGTDRNFTKNVTFFGRRHMNGNENLVTERDRVTHAKLRRAFNPGFSERSLREQEPIISKYADLFVWRLGVDSDEKQQVNLVDAFLFATFDITAELTFGESMGLLAQGRYPWWVKTIFDGLRVAAVNGLLIRFFYPFDKYIIGTLLLPFRGKVTTSPQIL
jgi:cytochrome P450